MEATSGCWGLQFAGVAFTEPLPGEARRSRDST